MCLVPLLPLVSSFWRALFHRSRMDEELDEEIRAYVGLLAEEKTREGLGAEEAVRASLIEAGGVEQVKERVREIRAGAAMETFLRDIRYGARSLARSPGFTAVAVFTLALGIGANTAIFSVVNAVLLRPLPYPHAERMAYVFETKRSDPKVELSLSPHNFTDLRGRNQSFDSYAAFNHGSFTLTGGDQPEALNGVMASADLGRVVGVAPAVGRFFTAEEDAPGQNHVALISDGLWRRRFGADRQAVGRSVQLNGEPYTIIGVMPPGFDFPNMSTEVWAPLALDLSKYQRGTAFLQTVARLKPGVTLEQAQADVQNIAQRLGKEFPDLGRDDFSVKVKSLHEHLFGWIEKPLLVLFGAVLLVLLIACLNVASLALGRATVRRKEMAVRSALGASRWSLARLLLTESVLLALAGAAAGLLLAKYGVDALTMIDPAALPDRRKVTIDASVVAFTFLTSLVTGVLFGLAPAWQAAKTDLSQAMRESSRAVAGGGWLRKIRGALVVAEISLSLVLLVSAGLLLKSFWKLLQVNPGFQPENVVTCSISLPQAKYPEEWQKAEFFRRTLEQARAIPGVQSAGFSTSLPFSGSRGSSSFSIDDRPGPRERGPVADRHAVAPGYFAVMGIHLRAGRDFNDSDGISHPAVVIINEEAARRFWPNENPVGKRLTIGMPQEVKLYGKPVSREIVGLVGNVKHEKLSDDFEPEMYIPAYQLPAPSMTLVVRGRVPVEGLTEGIRRAVQSVDPEQPIRRVQLLETWVAGSVAPQHFLAMLLLLFAAVALLLAAVGIYGVMSYTVTQRTHEIGIRMALGAGRHNVLRLVLGQGMVLALTGLGAGLALALASTRILASLLYGVSATDFATFAGFSLLLALVALLACLVPARRATRVDPIVALRYE